ncbi:hypothetical protein JZO67_004488 [Enterococcus sp. 665A]|uniref:Uncharacterized protein n=1 Tax=Candidatus Enterococcus ferrettii TaxID=2815324 RepID=A0ABV0EV31_9ENTE
MFEKVASYLAEQPFEVVLCLTQLITTAYGFACIGVYIFYDSWVSISRNQKIIRALLWLALTLIWLLWLRLSFRR